MKYSPNLKMLLSAIGLLLITLSAFAGKEGWMTDYEAAIAKAKEENKAVLVEFHGSDWCPPCMKLNKDVLATEAFQSLADDSLILVSADFPRKTTLPDAQREHNDALARKFGVEAFPTVVLVDKNGRILEKMVGFPRNGLEEFLSSIKANVGNDG